MTRMPSHHLGYLHLAPEYYIAHNQMDPRPEDIDVLDGLYSPQGSSRSGGLRDWWDHRDMDHDGDLDNVALWRHDAYFRAFQKGKRYDS